MFLNIEGTAGLEDRNGLEQGCSGGKKNFLEKLKKGLRETLFSEAAL